jgi:phospholipase/carboxylesterase
MLTSKTSEWPHQDQPIRTAGAPLDDARAALLLIHGRGATAESMLALADELDLPDVALIAPQAANRTWYPYSFMAPIQQNEPNLTSALRLVKELVEQVMERGFATEQIALLGFSQGACLATTFAARHPHRYGGVFGLSGGLIGPEDTPFDYDGSMEGTPVFLGCSDRDPHIPQSRVDETAEVFRTLGADVTKRIYEGMGHTVNRDEIAFVQETLAELSAP